MVKCRIDPADQINFQVTVKSFSHQWGSIMTLKLPDLSVKTSFTTLIPGNGLIELCRLFPGIVFQWDQFDLLHQNLENQFFYHSLFLLLFVFSIYARRQERKSQIKEDKVHLSQIQLFCFIQKFLIGILLLRGCQCLFLENFWIYSYYK